MVDQKSDELSTNNAKAVADLASSQPEQKQAIYSFFRQRQDSYHSRLNTTVAQFDSQPKSRLTVEEQQQRLYGVPITIKDSFDYKGTATTAGLPSRKNHIADATSPLVQALENEGAIVLGKTNVPEMLLYLETDNPVFGKTLNPWNLDRTPGGSSGGEAANIAAGGAQFGLGSDIGGSIRLPAHYCGIHGFKPTSRRLTIKGSVGDWMAQGQEAIVDQPGPLARHVDDIMLVMDILTKAQGTQFHDCWTPPVPFEIPSELPQGFRVGMYLDDGFFPVSIACQRAVQDAANAFRAAGIEVVDFQPPRVHEAMSIYYGILAADGGRWAKPWLKGGKHDPRLMLSMRLARLSKWQRSLLSKLLNMAGQHAMAYSVKDFGRCSTSAYWDLVHAMQNYIQDFSDQMRSQQVDIIICPPAATPAMTHGASFYLTAIASATMLYNLLGFPAGVVAASQVREEESGKRPTSRDLVHKAAAEVDRNSTGLPLGVQVVGGLWQDGLVLRAMKVLEDHFKHQDDYPVWPWRKLAF